MTMCVSGQIINGYEYVDLGLNVKWATCNVGASSPEDYGSYYAWGETSMKRSYTYYNSETFGKEIDDISGTYRDVARVKWGSPWRMPTKIEFQELLSTCIWTWTTRNGVNGFNVTSKRNGESIFLPAAGYRWATSLYCAGSGGMCWSSKPDKVNNLNAELIIFGRVDHDTYSLYRYYGFTVRPVSE